MTKKLAWVALLGLLGCPPPKPVVPEAPKPSFMDVMLRAEQERLAAAAATPGSGPFTASMERLAQEMKTTRDAFSPDPLFYKLADEAFQSAKESAARAAQNDTSGATTAWQLTLQKCDECHARYGGPPSIAAKPAP